MTQPQFIDALQKPEAYGHPVESVTLFETHISWVLLTGDYAYKIKKPVDFGFLDFSTLEKRRFYCTEEVRLNGRLAPELYLEVVPICGDLASPVMDGEGKAFEYAVKMRQFDTTQGFDQLLAHDKLTLQHMDETAQTLADFHNTIERAETDSPFGDPQAILQPALENFEQLQQHIAQQVTDPDILQQIQSLQRWTTDTHQRLHDIFAVRKQAGYVRECHGDLHLRNIVLWQGRVTPFDGIEFNPNLRWIDVLSELAFLLMDLDDHQRHDLAQRLLNAYLEITGDYNGLSVLPYYRVYRAMVRAKVASLRLAQNTDNTAEETQEIVNYIQLATHYTQTLQPKLIITHGLSGSGKTYVSQQIVQNSDLIRIRSDIERKRLFGLGATDKSDSGVKTGIYTANASQLTYERLLGLADAILKAGFSVLVDATFLRHQQRQQFERLAQHTATPFCILHCHTTDKIMQQRIRERNKQAKDASEADLKVLAYQQKNIDTLSAEERQKTISIDTSHEPHLDETLLWISNTTRQEP
jgi:hypothetical protein